jgi:acetyl-CoA acetyltransferase
MTEAYICDAARTPIGRYGGSLAHVRADDLAAVPIRALIARNPGVDWEALDDVIYGCANQAGEDNRNLARMAGLLAGLPDKSGGVTLNRLCGSGMDAVAMAARVIRGSEADLMIAGGSESMSRAPFVMAKATSAFDRNAEIYDTTIGWRFVNPKMKQAFGDDTMPSTAENVAMEFQVSREDQDSFAVRSQAEAAAAQAMAASPPRSSRSRFHNAGRSHRRRRRTSARNQRRGAGEAEADRPVDGTVIAGNARASMTAPPR